MIFAGGIPSRWVITLHSGSVIEVAADGYGEADGYLWFNVLVDASPEEQSQMVITWQVPGVASRVGVLVTKIPAVEVANVITAPSWFDDGSQLDSDQGRTTSSASANGRSGLRDDGAA
jgi:hypothetical protein